MPTSDSTIQIPQDVLFHELAGEAVLLNLQTGKYFGLDEIGTRMWMLLSENGSVEPVIQALLTEYDVEEEKLRHDLSDLIERLAQNGLVKLA